MGIKRDHCDEKKIEGRKSYTSTLLCLLADVPRKSLQVQNTVKLVFTQYEFL